MMAIDEVRDAIPPSLQSELAAFLGEGLDANEYHRRLGLVEAFIQERTRQAVSHVLAQTSPSPVHENAETGIDRNFPILAKKLATSKAWPIPHDSIRHILTTKGDGRVLPSGFSYTGKLLIVQEQNGNAVGNYGGAYWERMLGKLEEYSPESKEYKATSERIENAFGGIRQLRDALPGIPKKFREYCSAEEQSVFDGMQNLIQALRNNDRTRVEYCFTALFEDYHKCKDKLDTNWQEWISTVLTDVCVALKWAKTESVNYYADRESRDFFIVQGRELAGSATMRCVRPRIVNAEGETVIPAWIEFVR